ncbi:hypothetical protein EVAR_11666_1 [Eumeta japonica]|uniref:Uncharacterized protein n=1 Tax=Eumeta variegata TaxID=151549 RepID=A0A4C1U4N2_EUMVA|nr:hypothetical protein EVAR_11666_1 [Eumeta japonica]
MNWSGLSVGCFLLGELIVLSKWWTTVGYGWHKSARRGCLERRLMFKRFAYSRCLLEVFIAVRRKRLTPASVAAVSPRERFRALGAQNEKLSAQRTDQIYEHCTYNLTLRVDVCGTISHSQRSTHDRNTKKKQRSARSNAGFRTSSAATSHQLRDGTRPRSRDRRERKARGRAARSSDQLNLMLGAPWCFLSRVPASVYLSRLLLHFDRSPCVRSTEYFFASYHQTRRFSLSVERTSDVLLEEF